MSHSVNIAEESTVVASAEQDVPILELVNLKKIYNQDLLKPKQTVIDELTCRFPAGKCTGFLGHNGAGKTTTIRTIFGLIKPDRGEVRFKGRPIARADKARIGYMPELDKLPRQLTCMEILRHHLSVFGTPKGSKPRDLIQAKLTEVGLWEHRDKKVGKLSKGMGRRLAWAQATIHAPELAILDEPFSGLDPLGREEMLGWIKALKRQKTSIILCTHELHNVVELCDEVHVLRRGSLAFSTLAHDGPSRGAFAKRYYSLTISGCDEASLATLRSDERLPAWTSLSQAKFLVRMRLGSYPEAAQWMRACLDRGLVITEFHDTSSLDPNELVQYFDGSAPR